MNKTHEIDYIIPGNDDSSRSIELYTRAAADAILEARSANSVTVEEELIEIDETPAKEDVKLDDEAQSQ